MRLTAEERLHLPRTPAPSVVLCRPDAWGRVSFAATPVSIVGWVRLAQRVPVRIRITDVPAGVPLVSGMTATVTIRGTEPRENGDWLRQRFASLADRLGDIVHGPQPSAGCVPRIGDENGTIVTLPTPKPIAPLNPEEINPGLAPGINKSPRAR